VSSSKVHFIVDVNAFRFRHRTSVACLILTSLVRGAGACIAPEIARNLLGPDAYLASETARSGKGALDQVTLRVGMCEPFKGASELLMVWGGDPNINRLLNEYRNLASD
jgi:hypothetical protein